MLHLILTLLLGLPKIPTITETKDRVLHVEFEKGASQVCVYLQRQVKEEVDVSTNDEGYYTPSSCIPLDPDDDDNAYLDNNLWNLVMPWFEDRKIEQAQWLYWAVIDYPTENDKVMHVPTEVHEVTR